jgi:hypothetical protein
VVTDTGEEHVCDGAPLPTGVCLTKTSSLHPRAGSTLPVRRGDGVRSRRSSFQAQRRALSTAPLATLTKWNGSTHWITRGALLSVADL